MVEVISGLITRGIVFGKPYLHNFIFLSDYTLSCSFSIYTNYYNCHHGARTKESRFYIKLCFKPDLGIVNFLKSPIILDILFVD